MLHFAHNIIRFQADKPKVQVNKNKNKSKKNNFIHLTKPESRKRLDEPQTSIAILVSFDPQVRAIVLTRENFIIVIMAELILILNLNIFTLLM